MREIDLQAAARELGTARATGRRIRGLPASLQLQSLEQGYAVQRRLIEQGNGKVAGWKLACTSRELQERYKVSEPYFGPLFDAVVFSSGLSISAADYEPCGVECEFAFLLGEDISAVQKQMSLEAIGGAVRAVRPAIEIVSSRFVEWKDLGAATVVADVAGNGGLVVGSEFRSWRELDLVNHAASLIVNGREVGTGTGAAVLENPLNGLAWLVNSDHRWFDLKAGDLVTTGSVTGLKFVGQGSRVVGEFGRLGQVEITIN
jgi:2-keto-4-pentenoate hydratase